METQKKGGSPLTKPSFWIRIILSVGLLAFLVSQVDLSEIWDRLVASNKWYILVAFLLGMVDRVLMAFKWNVLLKAKGMNIPLARVTFVYWKTTFLGLFLPATVGGDALRAYALSRNKNYPMSDVVSSIIVERALGFLALFVMVVFSVLASLFILGETFFEGMTSLLWVFLGLTVVGLVGMYFTMRQDILKRIG
ncbi:MAG: flippase-like domain-containing protein, partial [Anaerolineae bacterium]|nr:flippase-like domain-containing protein [Anaerolineae bacterium]